METRWLKRKNPDTNEEEKFFPITHAKAIIYGDNEDITFEEMYELVKQTASLSAVIEISLPVSGWSSSYPYTQTISHSSIKESSSPTLIKNLNSTATEDEIKAYDKAFGLIFYGETSNGSVTVYAKSLPEIDFVIGLKGV